MNNDTRIPCCASVRHASATRVEAALGRELLAALGHQAAVGRAVLDGKFDHLLRHGHLEVHARLCCTQQELDIARLNVAAVLAQVHGDTVRARLLGDQSRRDGIGITRVTGLAQCRDVIDVDA
jgi:hypothetical protein